MEEKEIKCPHCGKIFKIDASGYANIVKQVRDEEFKQELSERLHTFEKEKAEAIKLAEANTKNNLQKILSEKETDLLKLQNERDNAINELKTQEQNLLSSKAAEIKLAEEKIRNEFQHTLANAKLKLNELEANLKRSELEKTQLLEKTKTEQELAITKAVSSIERERDQLKNDLKSKAQETENVKLMLKDKYEGLVKFKDEEIERLKDMKARLSTKMVGESLEQHCENEFNKLRATGFQNAYFEKDNAVSKTTGSKGDYVYREKDQDGNEIISIMFEMKNENDTTATKHKNEHFFKELDKDRHEKECEYAVLVSLLESNSDFYNTGIVDVSFQSGFEKMYVIRPQFFIPMITLLRNAALGTLSYKAELASIKEQNLDITNFEDRIENWKKSFGINSERASKNFNKAITEIETSIKKLENTRDALIQTVKNFETANKKLDDLTIKKLTRGNQTMTAKFKELDKTDWLAPCGINVFILQRAPYPSIIAHFA